jgi:Putative zinc-finger
MDHTQAIHNGFAERYLLGELNPAEREEFEAHYFDCSICGDDVQVGAVFVDNARSLLRSEEAAVSARTDFPVFGLPFRAAALASVCLLGLVSYQTIVVIPEMRTIARAMRVPEIPKRFSLLGMGSRAKSHAIVIPSNKDVELELEVPGSSNFSDYKFKIVDAKNIVKFILPVSSAQAKDTVPLTIPAGSLAPGTYEIAVVGNKAGQPETPLSSYPVSVE